MSPEAHARAVKIFEQVKSSGGLYTPAGEELTAWFPGTFAMQRSLVLEKVA